MLHQYNDQRDPSMNLYRCINAPSYTTTNMQHPSLTCFAHPRLTRNEIMWLKAGPFFTKMNTGKRSPASLLFRNLKSCLWQA